MAMNVSGAGSTTLTFDARYVRILKWTFRRDSETVVCELGLTSDDSGYELRINPPANPAGAGTELFNDAMAAFQRHAMIERILVRHGWSLDTFESNTVARL